MEDRTLMDRIEKTIVSILCLLAGVLLIVLVVRRGNLFSSGGRHMEPFYPDRVVTVRIVMAEKDWQWTVANARAEQYVRADFWFDGCKYPNVAVRPKGNSSLMSVAGSGSPRLSLKVDFNFFNSAQTFRGIKKLSLNNGFSDPTYMREMLGYEVFKEMGLPTPRAAFVDLYVNNTHLGVYTQVEAIDKAFLNRHFANPNGNLYKPEIGAATLNWTQEDLKKNAATAQRPQEQKQKTLALNIGGSRLGDLLRLLERERSIASGQSEPNVVFPNPGFFPGPPPGGFGAGMPPQFGPGQRFGPPAGQFGNDAGPFPPGGPDGQMPPPGGFPGRFGPDPNSRFANAGRPFGPGQGGGRFPGPGGFGGPGWPFGRGGNLLETMGLKTNENYQNHTRLFGFLDVLNNAPDETFAAEIEKVLDVDQVLRYLAVSSMLVHLDNYTGMGHNYYLYDNNGRFTLLPWDLNMAFGTFNMGVRQGDIADFYIDEPVTNRMEDRPLVKRLLAEPNYLQRYHKYHEELLAGSFAEGVLEARIDKWAALIRPYVEKDELKFFSMEQFERGLNEGNSGVGWMGNRPQGRMMNDSSNRPSRENPQLPPQANTDGQNRQLRSGQSGRQGPAFGWGAPGGAGGPGMSAPGLKSFIAKRRISVRKQLDGELPSKPTDQQRQQNNPWPFMPGPMPENMPL